MKTWNSNISFSVSELADKVGAEVTGNGEVAISSAGPIESATDGQITFVANSAYAKHLETTAASAVVLDFETKCERLPAIRHKQPYLTFAKIIDLLYADQREFDNGCHASAIVDDDAQIDSAASVGALCHIEPGAKIGAGTRLVSSVYVGRDVVIGEGCLIYPGVRIMDGCQLGNNIIIHSSTVIGSDGFGFAPTDTGLKKIKQVGWVEIGDDVEIGSNVSVDRGALGPTRIGAGTKIDNLVQIAHNVETGQHCIIVSQTGISGSTRLGNGVVLAGQSGIVGHIEIGDGAIVGAQSGVSKSIPPGKTVFGSPAREIMLAKRIEAAQKRLPELLKRVRDLEKKIEELSGD